MTARPDYFERIRVRASKRWDQLEADPELAGPWYQLFKQVQSPRHVLSELLQNADDAGATEAAVALEGNRFVFRHNGEDFTEEHFASLCRFGYSNKRSLHTIGFRGIGFKSTFSLGDRVELRTPTLAVAFDRRRFTEPKWLEERSKTAATTEVSVAVSDENRRREIEKNLNDWLKSPVSLLFFRRIRRLRIGPEEVAWRYVDPGPASGTSWMALSDVPGERFLVARSAEEEFPPDAIDEIRQERLLETDQVATLPPCRVEIVLGAKGALYVVLPTGVETELPFACNAPFIQDPARLKIKDPEISPTNRWLLGRIGRLAAEKLLGWLANEQLNVEDRARAYELLPDVDRNATSIGGASASAVVSAVDKAITEHRFLLTEDGSLEVRGKGVAVPHEILQVWPGDQAAGFFDPGQRPLLSQHISSKDRDKLTRWRAISTISKDRVLEVLRTQSLPKPETWLSLLKLWAYVAPQLTSWNERNKHAGARIVPVQGQKVLHAAADVVRLGDKRLLKSEDDWDFLAGYLLVLNPNWPRFLAEQRRESVDNDAWLAREAAAALEVQRVLGLDDASNIDTVVERVARAFFAEIVTLNDAVRFAHVAAALNSSTGPAMRFATRDGRLRPVADGLMWDAGAMEGLLPGEWASEHVLHHRYDSPSASCSPEEWRKWISDDRSGVNLLPPLVVRLVDTGSRQIFEKRMRAIGYQGAIEYPFHSTRYYPTQTYAVEDFDFPESVVERWTEGDSPNDALSRLVAVLFDMPESFWRGKERTRGTQTNTAGQNPQLVRVSDFPFASWVQRLREYPCLPSTRGTLHKPTELLRRTPDTEPFMDVEPFVAARLDTEKNRPLLALLGVRDKPTSVDSLLAYLRSFAKSSAPPANEVDKWYRRIDAMMDSASTAGLATVREAFRDESIVLTENAGWTTATGAFLSADEEDAPGSAVIRNSVRDLAMWRKVGVAERPTADLAIQWLRQLPSGEPLSKEDERRVQSLQKRHALRIWRECAHWLNLAHEWVPVSQLEYALTMQSLVEWSYLHDGIKQRTADLRLPVEITSTQPFVALKLLSNSIEERLGNSHEATSSPSPAPWLAQLAVDLARVDFGDLAETERVRGLGSRLAVTRCFEHQRLNVVPYLNGLPAGTARDVDVVWLDDRLLVAPLPRARLARLVPERLGREFGRQDVLAALSYCFARSEADVAEYMEENFKLSPIAQTVAPAGSNSAAPDYLGTDSDADDHSRPDGEGTVDTSPGADSHTPNDARRADVLNQAPAETDVTVSDVRQKGRGSEERGRRSSQIGFVDRFAASQGFKPREDGSFVRLDGSYIAKDDGSLFPWVRRDAHGSVIRRYWLKEHSLEEAPLEIGVDVWSLIEKFGDAYALVLLDVENHPVEMLGDGLRAIRDAGQLAIFPATYRLTLKTNGRK